MKHRLPLALPLVFLLCLPAFAAPDSASIWKKNQRVLTKNEEKPFWDDFERELGKVWAEWRTESSFWRGDREANRYEVHSLERIRNLYLAYVDIQNGRLDIDDQLAASGSPKAAALLLEALFDVIKECEALDKEIAGGRPIAYYSLMYDQAPAVRRHGLGHRHLGLVRVLGRIEGVAAWLADAGWADAVKGDRKKSLLRRAAVLDALGTSKDAAARPRLEEALQAPEPGLRIVAVENLVPFGIDTKDVLKPLLADPAPAVRRALLESIARCGADEPRWIAFALEAYQTQKGLVRARALEALGALTGEVLPDEPKGWEAWYAERKLDIDAGVWKKPAPVEETVKPKEPGDAKKEEPEPPPRVTAEALTTFYGVGAPSQFVIYAFDGSTDMDLPADLQTMLTKSKNYWQATASTWRKEMLDHRTLLLRELDAALTRLPDHARFAIIHLWGTNLAKIPVMGAKKPLESKKSTRRKIARTIEKQRPQGQYSVEEATRIAFRVCGQDPLENPKSGTPLLDSMFLVAPGWQGGRWAIPEALIADFRRCNRFHRLQVNTIRIADQKEESERLMKGLAEASGGVYVWMEALP